MVDPVGVGPPWCRSGSSIATGSVFHPILCRPAGSRARPNQSCRNGLDSELLATFPTSIYNRLLAGFPSAAAKALVQSTLIHMWGANSPCGCPIMSKPNTLGALKSSPFSRERLAGRGVREEVRENLIRKLETGDELFPGIIGYSDSVVPPLVNALLSRHHFILLGLRGQAKSRILRGLTSLLDDEIPVVEGCEIHDSPYIAALSRLPNETGRARRRDSRPLALP